MSSEYIGKRENEEKTVMCKRQEVIGKGLTNVFVVVIRVNSLNPHSHFRIPHYFEHGTRSRITVFITFHFLLLTY